MAIPCGIRRSPRLFRGDRIETEEGKNVQQNSDVILRERSDTKDLRADPSANVIESAKILRLHPATLRMTSFYVVCRCLELIVEFSAYIQKTVI